MNDYPTANETKALADELGQMILRTGRDYLTIPWGEFYALVKSRTGKDTFDEGMLRHHFRESVLGGKVPFLINYGTNIVFICKDANFAPIDL
jgi:hypothetical protein